MAEQNACPRCGASLADDSPAGLCPKCLLQAAEESSENATLPPQRRDSTEDATILPADGSPDPETVPPTHPMAADDAQPVGTKVKYFGDYELLEEIARGGMGVVYKAKQTKLNRTVALKMILAGQLASEQDVQRFYLEAEAAAKLDHKGIVPIYEIGEHEGQHFFSMAFVEGASLADMVKDGPLPPRDAAHYVKRIAEAVQVAHAHGVIHRDLKPANVLIDGDDQPKVTDFGLAKQIESDSGMTATGQVMGTPSYMPPEQATGSTLEVGPLSDVYSLGAILYCLLTGRPPFQASSTMDTLMQVLEKDPLAPQQLNPAVDLDLQTITLKCLEKAANRRYQSAQALAEELGRSLKGEPIEARPISPPERLWRWCTRKPILAALYVVACSLLLLIAVGGPIVAWNQSVLRGRAENLATKERQARQLAVDEKNKADLLVLEKSRLVSDLEIANAKTQAEAETNRHLLYIARMREAQRAIEMGDLRRGGNILESLVAPAGKRDLRGIDWSYLWNLSHTYDVSIKTREDDTIIAGIAHRPGTSEIAIVTSRSIVICDRSTGKELRRTRPFIKTRPRIRFSDDGRRLACAFQSSPDTIPRRNVRSTVHVFDADSLRPVYEINDSADLGNGIWDMTFAPDNSVLAIGTASAGVHVFDLSSGRTTRLIPNVTTTQLQFVSGGDRLIGLTPRTGLTIWNAASGERQGSFAAKGVQCFDSSSDGRFVIAGHDVPDARLTLWDLRDLSQRHEYPGHDLRVLHTVFSRDGQFIVSGGADEFVKVWSVDNHTLVRSVPTATRLLALSTDGEHLATSDMKQVQLRSDWLNAENDHTVATDQRIPLAVSQDGTKWIARRGETVFVCDRDGKELHTLNDLDLGPSYLDLAAVVGDEVVIRENESLSVFDLNTAELRMRIQHDGDQKILRGFSAPQNGQSFATAGLDGTVRVFQKSGRQTVKIDCRGHHTSMLDRVCLSPDIRWLGSSSVAEVIFWDIPSGARRKLEKLSGQRAACMAFSSDGALVAMSDLSEIRVFRTPEFDDVATLSGGQKSMVTSLTFSPDDRLLVAGAADGTTRIWDLEMQDQRLAFSKHQLPLLTQFAKDGSELVTAGPQSLRFWPVQQREIVERTID